MPRVVTITINPAIDKSSTVAALIAEKKLECSPPVYEPGGGGINVARVIHRLGGDVAAVYFSGGRNGLLLQQLLTKDGIANIPVAIREETRENFMVHDLSTNQQYRFGMPGPGVTAQECQDLFSAVRKMKEVAYIVLSGSLTHGVPDDFIAEIAKIATQNKARLIVDSSGRGLQMAVGQGVYLIKPNIGELASLACRKELLNEDIVEVVNGLINKKRAEIVVVSLGAAGAMIFADHEMYRITAPTVKRKSTVGAGDSMLGGIIMGFLKGFGIEKAASYGVACGTAATMNSGTQLCNPNDVELLFGQMNK